MRNVKQQMVWAAVLCTSISFFPEAAFAQGKCQEVKGRFNDIYQGGPTSSGIITNAGALNGTTLTVFNTAAFPTPESTIVSYAADLCYRKEQHMKQITAIALGMLSIVPGLLSPGIAQGATEEIITFDVALDCRTFNYNRGVPLDQIVRGDGFILSGKIFPAGTLLSGSQTNDPNAPGSIGTFVSRGTTTGTLAEHLANPNVPGVFVTEYLLLNNGRGLVGDGWFAPGGTNQTAITGGWGAFRGAGGEMSFATIGTNGTGCPNQRATIILVKQAPK